MRFMVIVKASKDSEAGKMPSEELLGAMAKFNEELVKAGVMWSVIISSTDMRDRMRVPSCRPWFSIMRLKAR